MKQSKFETIHYFIKPYPVHILAITGLIFSFAALEGLNMGILFSVLQSALAPAGTTTNAGIMRYLNKIVAILPINDPLIAACILLIATATFKNVIGYSRQCFCAYTGYKIWEDNQARIFKKYIQSDYQQLLDAKQGEILFRICTTPSYLGFILNSVPQIVTELIKVVVISGLLFSLASRMTLCIVLLCLFYYLFTRYIAKNISYHLGQGRVEAGERQNVLILEMASGIRQIKLFNSESRWIKKFHEAMRKYFNLALQDSMWLAVPNHLLDFTFITALSLVLIAVRILHPAVFYTALPLLGIFAYAFLRIMPSLNTLSTNWLQLMSALPNLEMLRSVMERKMQDIRDGHIEVAAFRDNICFEKVGFSYPGRHEVLQDVSFEFKKGARTAIVGPSGAGKTTIVDLLIRLFEPGSGRILIDGQDIGEIRIATWLKKIGYVSQDTFIFNATIAENISFGAEGATPNDVVRAAKSANAYDFIMQFPEGFNTIVGDRGLKLSGGQRQRIAIARALFRKPEILILDEATSSLDNISEASVQEAINGISKDRTVIIIAHRLSTIVNADKIIVLDGGRVVEEEKHETLLQQKGLYWNLYNSQAQNVEGNARDIAELQRKA